MDTSASASEWDPRDFVEERYPKRSRKNKIDDLSLLDEPEPDVFVNKAERLCQLPYPVDEILSSDDYAHDEVILTLSISEFTIDYIRNSGLLRPLLFSVPPEQLGMRMPNPQEFTVSDVLELVGGQRRIEVVEVYEQKGTYMQLKDFINYYKQSPSERTKLLNVLSLEFTNTRLAEKVSAPAFVSEIDWIDNVWPKELFIRQENLLQKSYWARNNDFSTYPKVQRYCLMSVANCFTDFHIAFVADCEPKSSPPDSIYYNTNTDFGGTSVWYHILKGEKIFWMIEPSEENLNLYEEWILNGSENSCFFGKFVNKCARVRLCQGDTLIIPSGWIHCVYTPVDSLVFGGNFLHSYSIPMQIRVSKSEDRIKIGSKYRFPHFKQMFWCFISQLVQRATHRIYQKKLPEEAHNILNSSHKPDHSISELSSANEDEEKILSDLPNVSNLVDTEDSTGKEVTQPANDKTPQLTADGEEICYDEMLGNAVDGSFTFNPIQSIYDSQNYSHFTPAPNYDIDYLRSLPPLVINGLFSLADYAKRLLKSKQPEVTEGITRPHHLVKEFWELISKINELGLVSVQLRLELAPKDRCGYSEFTVPKPKEEPISLSVKLPPKDDKRKIKRHGTINEAVQKKALKKKNALTSPAVVTSNGLVGGLPLSTSGFDPMGEIVKLGMKPMQSAWRKASNMAKPPPPTYIHQLKKRCEIPINNNNGPTTDFPSNESEMEKGTEGGNESTVDDASFATQSISDRYNREKKTSHKHRKPVLKTSFARLVENHDDSPEFSHRSPLQQIKCQQELKIQNSQQTVKTPNAQPFSTFAQSSNNNTPRNEKFGGHQRNYDQRRSEGGGNRGFNNNQWGGRGDDNRGFSNNQWGRGDDDNKGNFRQHSKSWNSFGGADGGGRGQWNRTPNDSRGKFNHNRRYSRTWDRNSSQQQRWSMEDGNNDGGGFAEGRNEWNSFGNQPFDDNGGGCFNLMATAGTSTSFNNWNTAIPSTNFSQQCDANNFASVDFGGYPAHSAAFEQNPTSSAYKPLQQQQKYELGQQHQSAEPISNAVNELHHISQIMDAPSSVGLSEMNVEQIPLPPTDRPTSANLPKFSRFFSESEKARYNREQQQRQQQQPPGQQQSVGPFADVDELESITRMMHE